MDRLRATPLAVAEEGVGDRAGALDGDGDAFGGSVEDLRPPAVPASGFFVAVFMVEIV